MPLYEYQCQECDEVVELLLGVDEEPEDPCEKCGSTHLARLLSTFCSSTGAAGGGGQAAADCPQGFT